MFERKLTALEYHSPNNFDYLDEKVFRNFISWLENQKIRLYPIEQRTSLDNIESDTWNQAYEKYLNDLEIENLNGKLPREEQIEIILTHAIRLEYTDNVDKINTFRASQDELMKQKNEPSSLENIDYNSVDFVQGMNRLQCMLNVPSKPHDNLAVLQAISQLISEKLNPKTIQTLLEDKNASKEPVQLTLSSINSGIECKDPILNEAVKVLRLLHIKELRELQTKINDTIVGIQTITANPKTDSSLGKVGF